MAHGSLTTEGILQTRLNTLNASLRSFSSITGISLTTLSRTMSGERHFTEAERANVEDTLDKMGSLLLEIRQKTKTNIGIDWSAGATADAIIVRKHSRYLALVDNDHGLEQAAKQFSDRTPTLAARPEVRE
jgi:hypothetical protein